MFKIKTLNKIAPVGLSILQDGNYVLDDTTEQPDGILIRSASVHDMQFPSTLACIARAGAGVNNIPIEKCSEKGIVVFNTPGANANAVKELAIAALLISSRKIVQGITWTGALDGQQVDVPKKVEEGKGQFTGPELEGKRLGVIGLGAIGVMVANTAVGMGMEVLGFDPYISVDAAWGLSRSVKKAPDYTSLLQQCDYITLHIPLTPETKSSFNTEAFSKMRQGVRIINLSRGELVNDEDIIMAIKEGKVTSYVTDFPNKALLNVEGIITIPHLGASTPESEDNCAVMAARQLKDYLENGNIFNSVNFPSCTLSRVSDHRITIAHQNIPNMLGQISTDLAKGNINILNMLNSSKGSYAYTIIDAETPIPAELIKLIGEIEGVLRVRVV